MNLLLDEIEKNLKKIHFPLCDLEKYAFDYENDSVNKQIQNIHKGYMEIQTAINKLKEIGE